MAFDNHHHTTGYSTADESDEEEYLTSTTPSDRYLMVPVPSSSNSAVIRYVPDTKPPPTPLFQRLWTDEDEIELLNGFLTYTSRSGWLNSSHHHDTSAFYAEIKPKLNLSFNKSQLVEKLRRLKKKYRTVATKLAVNGGQNFQFKTPHDEATFRISHKIWSFAVTNIGASLEYPDEITVATKPTNPNLIDHNNDDGCKIGARKRPREQVEPIEDAKMATPVVVDSHASVSILIEEAVKVCATPVIKELVRKMRNAQCGGFDEGTEFGGMLTLNPMNLVFSSGSSEDNGLDEKLRKHRLLELEVLSKRVELVQVDIKLRLEELRSKSN